MGDTSIWDVLNSGIESAGSILGRRYGTPQVDPGTYYRNPDGTLVFRQPPGYPVSSAVAGGAVGGDSSLLLLMLLVVGVGIAFMAAKK